MFFEGLDEVVSVFCSSVLNTKVVDNKGENDRAPAVSEEAGCVGGWVIPIDSKTFGE